MIVTTGTPGTLAAKRATSTILLSLHRAPIRSALVWSRLILGLGRQRNRFYNLGPELEGKRVQLLKEAVPGLSRIAVMWNPANPGIVDFLHQMRAAAAALNITAKPIAEVAGEGEAS